MFENRSIDELIRLAAAGGGMEIRAGARPTNDLIRLAAAANIGGATLYLRQMAPRSIEELIRIAAAGQGAVVFSDPLPTD